MNLWKRIEFWNLEASQCYFHGDIHTATLISVHALKYLHQQISKATANDNKSDSNYNERIYSYIDFISRYSCLDATATRSQKLSVTPNSDSKLVTNNADKTDIKRTSSNISSEASHTSSYKRFCNESQDLPATATVSFDVFPVRQLHNKGLRRIENTEFVDDEIYSSVFVWKTNAVRKLNKNCDYQTEEASVNSTKADVLFSSCISTDEMMTILIFNTALLYHRRALQKEHSRDYLIAIESYHQALQILEDKVLPNYLNKKKINQNSKIKHTDSNMMIEGSDEQLNDYFHLLSCKSTFLVVKAAILNNRMHIYRILYHIEEAREVVNELENLIVSCNHSDDFDTDESLYYDNCNSRIERRNPINISIENSDSTMINCHDDSNDYEDDEYWPLMSEEDYYFFENNIRFLRMHNFQNAPAA